MPETASLYGMMACQLADRRVTAPNVVHRLLHDEPRGHSAYRASTGWKLVMRSLVRRRARQMACPIPRTALGQRPVNATI